MHSYDSKNELVPEYILVPLMSTCSDFQNEISQLQHIGNQINVMVMTTPKYLVRELNTHGETQNLCTKKSH